jgi:hypothetical protein
MASVRSMTIEPPDFSDLILKDGFDLLFELVFREDRPPLAIQLDATDIARHDRLEKFAARLNTSRSSTRSPAMSG